MQESLLHYHHFRMKMSWLFYPLEYMFLEAQLTDTPGCSERAPERVSMLVILLNLLTNLLLISQNIAVVSTSSENLTIESLMFHLSGVVYVYITDRYQVKAYQGKNQNSLGILFCHLAFLA